MLVEKIIDLVIEDGKTLDQDLDLLRTMGFEKEVFQALLTVYKANKIELDITKNSLETLEDIYYDEFTKNKPQVNDFLEKYGL